MTGFLVPDICVERFASAEMTIKEDGALLFQDRTREPPGCIRFASKNALDNYLERRSDVQTWEITDTISREVFFKRRSVWGGVETFSTEENLFCEMSRDTAGVWKEKDVTIPPRRKDRFVFDTSGWFSKSFTVVTTEEEMERLYRQREESGLIKKRLLALFFGSLIVGAQFNSLTLSATEESASAEGTKHEEPKEEVIKSAGNEGGIPLRLSFPELTLPSPMAITVCATLSVFSSSRAGHSLASTAAAVACLVTSRGALAAPVEIIDCHYNWDPYRFDDLFKGVDGYAYRNHFAFGFPTCHIGKNLERGVILYGKAFSNGRYSTFVNIPDKELNGDPSQPADYFRKVGTYATSHGFLTGVPTFHEQDYGQGVVRGAHLLHPNLRDEGYVVFKDLKPGDDLGIAGDPRNDPFDFFRYVHDYATRENFVGGFPTFHCQRYEDGEKCGAYLFTQKAKDEGVVTWQDIPEMEIRDMRCTNPEVVREKFADADLNIGNVKTNAEKFRVLKRAMTNIAFDDKETIFESMEGIEEGSPLRLFTAATTTVNLGKKLGIKIDNVEKVAANIQKEAETELCRIPHEHLHSIRESIENWKEKEKPTIRAFTTMEQYLMATDKCLRESGNPSNSLENTIEKIRITKDVVKEFLSIVSGSPPTVVDGIKDAVQTIQDIVEHNEKIEGEQKAQIEQCKKKAREAIAKEKEAEEQKQAKKPDKESPEHTGGGGGGGGGDAWAGPDTFGTDNIA